jgi:hypothetical protein
VILIVFLNGEIKKFYFAKDVLRYVLENCPRVTFSFINHLTTWLDCKYTGLPFVCEAYDFYIIKKE